MKFSILKVINSVVGKISPSSIYYKPEGRVYKTDDLVNEKGIESKDCDDEYESFNDIYISKKKKLSDKKEMFALNEIAAEHVINNTCFFNSSVSDNDYFGAIILHFLKLTHLTIKLSPPEVLSFSFILFIKT